MVCLRKLVGCTHLTKLSTKIKKLGAGTKDVVSSNTNIKNSNMY